MSRIPLFGLHDSVDVIRIQDADDGAGGIAKGVVKTVYSGMLCRITNMDDVAASQGFGNDGQQKWMVIARYSPKIQNSDFLRIPWGVFPNIAPLLGQEDSHPPKVTIDTPAGIKILNWSELNSRYEDATQKYIVDYTTAWRFRDLNAPITYLFNGYPRSNNIFKAPWSVLISSDYSVESTSGNYQDYRVLRAKHQRDDQSSMHHTSLIIEYEDKDA